MRAWSRILRIDGPVRTAEPELLDAFLVSAVATVLGIRILLEATGYPQLGGNGLHVAHVLWGGLGMLVAIVLLLLFLSSSTRRAAAILGGAGFGAFIDELGKFVTSDNNYFFKPTAALVYVVFVLLFLVTREVLRFRALSPRENLVNAVELTERLAMGNLTDEDRDRALVLLAAADERDPLVGVLRDRFQATAPRPLLASRVDRFAVAVRRRYAAIAASSAFHRLIAAIFILRAIGFLLSVAAAAAVIGGSLLGFGEARAALDEATDGSTLTSWIQLFAGVIAGVFIVRGVVALRGSRTAAYRAFEIAILVELLLAQPFAFLESGFVGAFDVLFDLALLATLRYLQTLERSLVVARPIRAQPDSSVSVARTGTA